MDEILITWELDSVSQVPLLRTGLRKEALLTGHLITAGKAASPVHIQHMTLGKQLTSVPGGTSQASGRSAGTAICAGANPACQHRVLTSVHKHNDTRELYQNISLTSTDFHVFSKITGR